MLEVFHTRCAPSMRDVHACSVVRTPQLAKLPDRYGKKLSGYALLSRRAANDVADPSAIAALSTTTGWQSTVGAGRQELGLRTDQCHCHRRPPYSARTTASLAAVSARPTRTALSGNAMVCAAANPALGRSVRAPMTTLGLPTLRAQAASTS